MAEDKEKDRLDYVYDYVGAGTAAAVTGSALRNIIKKSSKLKKTNSKIDSSAASDFYGSSAGKIKDPPATKIPGVKTKPKTNTETHGTYLNHLNNKIKSKQNDLKGMTEQQILDTLAKDKKIPYYQDLDSKKRARDAALGSHKGILKQEKKMHRALSQGISEQYKGKKVESIPMTIERLSKDLGIEKPELEFKYMDKASAYADINKNKITLDPRAFPSLGRESLIAHELRHLKESKGKPIFADPSIRSRLYTSSSRPLDHFNDLLFKDEAIKREQGKVLNYMTKKQDRLFPKDVLKPKIDDALDSYEFLEKGHFKKPFLSTNLKRVAKKLPIIGAAAGILTSPSVDAAFDPFMSEIIHTDPIEDPKHPLHKEATEQLRKEYEKRILQKRLMGDN